MAPGVGCWKGTSAVGGMPMLPGGAMAMGTDVGNAGMEYGGGIIGIIGGIGG